MLLIKHGMFDHWGNALQKYIGIRPLGCREGLILLQLRYTYNHSNVSSPHGRFVKFFCLLILVADLFISYPFPVACFIF